MWNRSFPLHNGRLYISWFLGETKVLSHHPSTKWTFVFLRACFVPGSHSAYVCSCQVPHFVEASGSYNPKSASKKSGLGWVPWFCRGNILLHFWQVPHSARAWGPKTRFGSTEWEHPTPPVENLGVYILVTGATRKILIEHFRGKGLPASKLHEELRLKCLRKQSNLMVWSPSWTS